MNAVQVNVVFEDGSSRRLPEGAPVCALLTSPLSPDGLPYIAALVNNDLSSLTYPLTVNSHVRFLTATDPHGWRVYRRSLSFLLAKTVKELFPLARFSLEHSMGPGLYCSFFTNQDDVHGITPEQLTALETRMRAVVAENLPIERRKLAFTDAVRELEAEGQVHKLNLLKYRNPPRVVMHGCDGYTDLAHGPLVPATGVLGTFALVHRPPGFVLQAPERQTPLQVPPFEDQPHLFQIYQEHKQWGRILGVNTIGRLNELTASGEIREFIMISESLHEKKCGQIADRIAARRAEARVVLIAGPSSAGKTTFAKKLALHLKINGLRPFTVSTDDYFLGPEHTPRDESGELDFEHIEAVDIAQFNADLLKLIEGQAVALPRFNFTTRQREYHGERVKIEPDQIVIVEGIHGLNPRLTQMIPPERTFRIYISALTQLSVDHTNRISTTDNRLIRRMVRDHRFRSHSAIETLQRWPSVRSGEKRWIFPFQREADATFNSALDYELAVLKPLVEPLLLQVKPSDPAYAESRRLTEFLLNFLPAPDYVVPRTSILREYIGGSGFHY